LKPWQIFLAVKATELAVHLRPLGLWRALFYRDRSQRRALRWCLRNSARVFLYEVIEFVFRRVAARKRVSLREYAGAKLDWEAPLAPAPAMRTPFHRERST
jgi:hypothetical protein